VPDDAAEFTLSEATWHVFVNDVASLAEVPYASQTMKAFESLQTTAQEELLDVENVAALEALKAGLQANVAADLERHKAGVQRALEQELVAHLYNTSGEYRHGLIHDPVALRAVELLETGEYAAMLTGPEARP